jgi:exodeoxyribonuclease III
MLKLATFNVNSIRSRLPIVLAWLAKHKPDVLAVQETKVQDADFPKDSFLDIGYNAIYFGQKAYNGVALFSPHALADVQSGLSDDDPESKPRLMRARLGDVHIINSYVPQGREVGTEYYQFKLDWLARFRRMLEREYRPDQMVAWMGDLNIAPEREDVYAPDQLEGHPCFNRGLTTVFKGIVDWGLGDVLRKHHPGPGHFTFFDYRIPGSVHKNQGWRLDHILVTKPLLEKSQGATIDLEPRKSSDHKPSDHTVLVADFDYQTGVIAS